MYENVLEGIKKALKMSSFCALKNTNLTFSCAGTSGILPDAMDPPPEQQGSSSESEDELNSSMEQEETSGADEGETRRLRRELLKTDVSILYESDDQDDRQGPVTRARKTSQESMEITSEQQGGEQIQSKQTPPPIPTPPLLPPVYKNPIGPMPENTARSGKKKISKPKPKYSDMIANKLLLML